MKVYQDSLKKKIGFIKICLIFLGFFILLVFLQLTRIGIQSNLGLVFNFEKFINGIFEFGFLSGLLSYFDYFARVLHTYQNDYLSNFSFEIFSYFFHSLIPTILSPFSKVASINKIFAEYWGYSSSSISPALSVFGELYIFGNVFDIIIGMSIYGYFSEKIYINSETNASYFDKLTYILFIQSFFLSIRTGIINSSVNFLLIYFIYSFISIFHSFFL